MFGRMSQWISMGVTSVVLFIAFLVLSMAGAPSGSYLVVGGVSVVLLTAVLVGFDIRARLGIHRALREGRPDHVLRTVEAMLPGQWTARGKAPLHLYRAAALSLKGQFAEALEILGRIDHDKLPRAGNKTWRIFHLGIYFDTLVFSRQLERARSLFATRLEPLASSTKGPAKDLLLDECRAVLLFLDGETASARELFEKLRESAAAPPVSQGSFHYFLGCIAEENGDRAAADEHFEKTIALAGETYLRSRVEALRAARAPAA